jgi:hypothetical protein
VQQSPADRAMDKTGIGDFANWQNKNFLSRFFFWAVITGWLMLLCYSIKLAKLQRSQIFL